MSRRTAEKVAEALEGLVPNQARYQATLHPDASGSIAEPQ